MVSDRGLYFFWSTSTLVDHNPNLNLNSNPNPYCYIRTVTKWKVMGHVHWLLQYLTSGVRPSRFYPFFLLILLSTCWNCKPSLLKAPSSQFSLLLLNQTTISKTNNNFHWPMLFGGAMFLILVFRVISLWLFRDTLGHWFCSINDGKHNQN